ncbi:MAG: glucosyltransferase domain-containing protein [Akkermansia sp.]|nr:glucosyltransferase domain-containing protein [Akkermansia sp.]
MHPISDNEKWNSKDFFLYIGSIILFIYIHLPLTLRMGYDADEILDFSGSDIARDTYLTCGRWGHVIWGYLVGDGLKPWSGGITAGLILCLALVLQTKILFASNTHYSYKGVYCALYLACSQFAYFLSFSMMAEGNALGIFFATLACYILFFQSPHFTLKRILLSIGCLYVALSFYQTSGLLFFTLFCCCLRPYVNDKKKIIKYGTILGLICLASLVLFFITKKIIVGLHIPQNECALSCTKSYENSLMKAGILHSEASLLHLLKLRFLMTLALNPYLFICTIIALVVWTYHTLQQRNYRVAILLAIALTIPYVATLFVCTWRRMLCFVPLISAFIITLTVSFNRDTKPLKKVYLPIVAILCIFAAHKVSNMALTERTRHDSNLLTRFSQYSEGRKLLFSSGMNEKTPIFIFEKNGGHFMDFYHSYPFKNLHLGTHAEYEKHKDTLKNMPSWPAPGCIQISHGCIIIKADDNHRW